MAVGLQQHFGVGPGREGVAEPFELRPQVLVIVDLAVEYDPLRGSACRHRLRPAGGEVEDGQSAVPQPHAERSVAVPVRGVQHDRVMESTPAQPTEQEALAVRSTVRLKVVHALQDRDRKSTRLNSSHGYISYAVFCLKKKKHKNMKSKSDSRQTETCA